MINPPSTCSACGHQGGELLLTAPDQDVPRRVLLAALSAGIEVPAVWVCGGRLFDLDGPSECLRRMVAVSG